MDDWATFGAKTPAGVSAAGVYDLGRRQQFGPDTTVDSNNTLLNCNGADVVNCTDGFRDSCCASGGQCCGTGCCGVGFKCGIKLLSKCCREDQAVCGGNGCYRPDDGETCCGGFEVCSKGRECCGLDCCLESQVCHNFICTLKSNVDVASDEDECCTAGGCCPPGSHCHRRECIPDAAGRLGATGMVSMVALVGWLVIWNW